MDINTIRRMTNEQRKKLKEKINSQIDLMNFVRELGYDIARNGRSFKLVEHDSVNFYSDTNTFYRWSAGKGGGPVDFLNYVYGEDHPDEKLDYLKCLQILSEYEGVNLDIDSSEIKSKFEPKKTHLTDSKDDSIKRYKLLRDRLQKFIINDNESLRELYNYLVDKRKLSKNVVDMYIQKGLLTTGRYQDSAKAKTCVFLGLNEYGLIANVTQRGMNTEVKFQQMMSNSDNSRGVFIDPNWNFKELQSYTLFNKNSQAFTPKEIVSAFNTANRTLLAAESSIEIMSIMTAIEEAGGNINDYAYLSCSSIQNYKAIAKCCELYGYKDAVVMFNDDYIAEQEKGHNWGKEKAEQAVTLLEGMSVNARTVYPSKGINDWNDMCKDSNFSSLAKKMFNQLNGEDIGRNIDRNEHKDNAIEENDDLGFKGLEDLLKEAIRIKESEEPVKKTESRDKKHEIER